MPEWHVLSARLTVFVAPDTVVPGTLWRDVVGEETENFIVQRAMATRSETGPFADGTLTLQIQPMRIDWFHEPVAGMVSEGGLPSVLGRFPTAAEPLRQLGSRWVTSSWFPSISRVALGFTLISATADRETGYRELEQFIDGVPNTPDATDFHYQVNRPRPSLTGLDGMQVNRLSKWSVGGTRHMVIMQANPNPILSPMLYYLRLELDINTSADFQGLIPQQSIESVINDLFSGANEICERGNRI